MTFLEKNLEEIVFNASTDDLRTRGLNVYGKRYRQLHIGNYGIADIVTFHRDSIKKEILITVYEFKKDEVNMSTFEQALRYVKGIQSYLYKRDIVSYFYGYHINFNIVLVGASIDLCGSFQFLPDIFENVKIIKYTYEFDGINFTEEAFYTLITEGF